MLQEEEVNLAREVEETDQGSKISIPFDPNDIKIDVKNLTIQHIIERLEHDEINFFTDYQRMPDLWDEGKKSRLVESILLNLPLPSFYFDGNKDDRWDIVDGLQRVSTIKHFVLGIENEYGDTEKLVLQELEFLTQYDGLTFDELPRPLQRRFKAFSISVYVIQQGTPIQVKYNLFKRINTAGLILTPQEIRHALNQGVATEFVKELAEAEAFRKATDGIVRSGRMQDRDFTNRFLSFYLLELEEYNGDLDATLSETLFKINENERLQAELPEIKMRFEAAMEAAYHIFGNDAFRKRTDPNHSRKPINKALFDSISVGFAKLSKEDLQSLVAKATLFKELLMERSKQDERFWRSISTATGDRSNLLYRFKAIQELIKKTLSL